jgi:hypothetical protein
MLRFAITTKPTDVNKLPNQQHHLTSVNKLSNQQHHFE